MFGGCAGNNRKQLSGTARNRGTTAGLLGSLTGDDAVDQVKVLVLFAGPIILVNEPCFLGLPATAFGIAGQVEQTARQILFVPSLKKANNGIVEIIFVHHG